MRMRFGMPAAMAALLALTAGAQTPPAAAIANLTFEVSSVKPSDPGARRGRSNVPLTQGDSYTQTDGYFSATGQSVARYIMFAYAMDPNPDPQINALPAWTRSEHFDIEARAKGPASKDEMRAMVLNLLKDRFKMQVHVETRTMNAYTVTVSKPGHFGRQMRLHEDEGIPCTNVPATAGRGGTAVVNSASGGTTLPPGGARPPSDGAQGGGGRRGGGGGPRITPDGYPIACGDLATLPGALPGRSRLGGRNITMANFVATLRGGMDRPVVDQTGLTGRYDWWFEYVPDASTDGESGANFPNPDPTGPKLWTAMKEQLGLDLKPVKTQVPWLVFDHIERPSSN